MEDEYEYAVRRVSLNKPGMTYIVGNFWSDRDDREQFLHAVNFMATDGLTYRLVRRKKAGPEEEVEERVDYI